MGAKLTKGRPEEERQGTQRASERSGKPQVGHVPSLAAGRAGLGLEWLREAGECGQPASRVGGEMRSTWPR